MPPQQQVSASTLKLPNFFWRHDLEFFYWCFFSPYWTLPFLFLIFINQSVIAALWYYQIFFRLPHFIMTYFILYEKSFFTSENVRRVLANFGPPLAIILLAYLGSFYNPRVLKFFILATFFFGYYHNASQAMGISLLFLKEKSLRLIRTVKLTYLIIFLITLEPMIDFIFQKQQFLPSWAITSLNIALVGSLIGVFAQLSKNEKKLKFAVYALTAVAVLFPWSFYHNYVEQFFVQNLHHALNYLGIGFASMSKERVNLTKGFRTIGIYLALLSLSLIPGFIYHDDLAYLNSSFSFVNCFFFIHYYVETNIWRDSGLKLKKIFLFDFYQRRQQSASLLPVDQVKVS